MSGSSHSGTTKPLLSNSSYDFLKRTATTLLPAASALYFALAQIWHLPNAEEVVGSIAAVNTFLGVIVGASSKSYTKSGAGVVGDLRVEDHPEDPTQKIMVAHFNGNLKNLQGVDQVTFKVDWK